MRSALSQRPTVLGEMGGRLGSWAMRRASSARQKPRERHLALLGQATGHGRDLRPHLRGKTPWRPTTRRVGKRMGFDPASAPSAHGAISGAHDRGDLLIALLGMLMGS